MLALVIPEGACTSQAPIFPECVAWRRRDTIPLSPCRPICRRLPDRRNGRAADAAVAAPPDAGRPVNRHPTSLCHRKALGR
eukprot:2579649-Pyramimonas_sp.AAC.2